MTLFQAKNEYFKNPTPETMETLKNTFRELVKNKEWLIYPCVVADGEKVLYSTITSGSQAYAVVFSCEEMVRSGEGMEIVMHDINDCINTIYDNPGYAGIVIDPFSENPLWLDVKQLQELSGIEDPRLQPRDWGEGIPSYEDKDHMTDGEILDFGMEVVMEYLENEKYNIYDASTDCILPANIIAAKDGNNPICIKIKTAVAPKVPELSEPEKVMTRTFAEGNKAGAYFAPVQIYSKDDLRKEAGLALCGDSFYVKFGGLTKLL